MVSPCPCLVPSAHAHSVLSFAAGRATDRSRRLAGHARAAESRAGRVGVCPDGAVHALRDAGAEHASVVAGRCELTGGAGDGRVGYRLAQGQEGSAHSQASSIVQGLLDYAHAAACAQQSKRAERGGRGGVGALTRCRRRASGPPPAACPSPRHRCPTAFTWSATFFIFEGSTSE